jgi:hypothetical protein
MTPILFFVSRVVKLPGMIRKKDTVFAIDSNRNKLCLVGFIPVTLLV